MLPKQTLVMHMQGGRVLLLLIISGNMISHSQAQFLKTTCRATAPAKCPGLCASSKTEKSRGYCTGDRCSRILAERSDAAQPAAATSAQKPIDPPPVSTITNQPSAVAPELPWWHQQQQAAVGVGDGVPQRVQPSQDADQPAETAEQQRAIIKHLQDIYSSECSAGGTPSEACNVADTTSRNAAAAASASGSDAARVITSTTESVIQPTAAAVGQPGAYTGPVSQVQRKLTFLSNTKIKIGLDMDRAGAISWLSSPLMPAPWKDKNLINIWDQGRLLQQSFYGCVDGSCWATNPWLWNPVQGGSWENQPGLTVKKVVQAGRLYVEGHGRNWGKQDIIKELLMTSDVTLKDNYAAMKFSMRYTGAVTHPYMTQEVPAVFVDRRFSVLAYYDGTKPWANDNAITYAFPPGRNMYARPTEFWAAFIDPYTGWGVGVFSPVAWMGITAYRIGKDGSDKPWDCSYFAHTIRMQLHPGMKPYTYTAYVTVGKLDTIRAAFYKLRATPGVMPVSKSGTKDPGESEVPGLTAGQPSLGRNPVFGRPANYSAFDNVLTEVTDPSAGLDPVDAAAAATAAAASGGSSSSTPSGGKAATGSDHQSETETSTLVGGDAGAKPHELTMRALDSDDVQSAAGKSSTKPVIAGVVAAFVGCALLAGTVLASMQLRRRRQQAPTQQHDAVTAAAAAADGVVLDNSNDSNAAVAYEEHTPPKTHCHSTSAEASSSEDVVAVITPTAGTPGVLTRSRAALANAQAETTGKQQQLP